MKTQALDAGLATGFAATERLNVRRDGGKGFAGLLDGERQRFDARAERNEGRSAFDVPAAGGEAARAEAAQSERRQIESRRAQAQQAERREKPRAAEPAPAEERAPAVQAKPAAEPAPQAAALAGAKRPEPAREEVTTPTDGDGEDAEAPNAEAAEVTDAATPADAQASPRTPPSPDTHAADANLRWSSTLALQLRPEAQRAQAGGDAEPASLARTTAAPAGAIGADASAMASTASTQDSPAAAAAFDAALATATRGGADAPRGPAESPLANTARIELPAAALAATPPASTATAAPEIAASAQAHLPAPMDSPAFGPQLGFQLASFVREGVQQAQLQLNPAEMGPVAVHIKLEGNQAQIDFAAAQQRTREVLEAHWPALAAALHGAGFTLGGGGVFEQRSQQGDAQGTPGDGAQRSGKGGLAGVEAGDAAVVRTTVGDKRGLLDLYA